MTDDLQSLSISELKKKLIKDCQRDKLRRKSAILFFFVRIQFRYSLYASTLK